MDAPSLLTGLTALVIWIPLAIGLLTLLGWLVMGDIDGLFAVAAIGVMLGMGFLAAKPPTPELPRYLAVASFAIVLLFPSAKLFWHRREMRQMELDAIHRAYLLLEFNRSNLGAKLRLARSVERLGYAAWAFQIGAAAFQGLDTRHYKDEMIMVQQWGSATGAEHRLPQRTTCPKCAAPITESDLFCQRCNGQVVWLRLKGYYGTSDWQSRVMWAWLASVAALVAIPWFQSSLTASWSLVATVSSSFVVIGLIIWAMLGGRKTD